MPGVEESVWETHNGSDIIPEAKSIPAVEDLLAQMELGIAPDAPNNDITNPAGRSRPSTSRPVRQSDAPMCMQCGVQMVRAGSCHACPSCGNTSGCS